MKEIFVLIRLLTTGVARLKVLIAAVFILLLPMLTLSGNSASATAFTLPSGNHIYNLPYAAGSKVKEITGATSGVLDTSILCASSCGASTMQIAGAAIDSTTQTMYVSSSGGSGGQIYKTVISGANAGVVSSVGYSGVTMFALAMGPDGLIGIGNLSLYSIDTTTGNGTPLRAITGIPAGSIIYAFGYNQIDSKYYLMVRDSNVLYSLNLASGVATNLGALQAPFPGGSYGGYSIQIDSNGQFWMLGSDSNLYTFAVSGSTVSAPTLQGGFGTFDTVAMALLAPPVSHTATFDSNGGTGLQTQQTGTSSAALPSTTTFTPPSGKRFWGWFDATTSGSYASTFDFATDKTFYAYWTGGPLTYSLTSGGTSEASIAMPTTLVGATNTLTLYVKNSSSTASTSLGNINGPNINGLTASNAGTCHTNNSLAANGECTVILTWTPSASGAINTGTTLSIQSTGTYAESVTLTGLAVTNKTVTFNKNDSSGVTSAQLAYSTQPLTANTWTRGGYTFAGWTTAADGTGTSFADSASYSFASNLTLYAKWTAIPVVVTPTAPAAPSAPAGPQIVAPSKRVFTEGESQALTIEGQRFDDLESVTINGTTVRVLSSDSGSIKLDLGGLAAGTYTINFKFKAGSLVYQDAITVKPKALPTAPVTTPVRKMAKLVPGFDGDSAKLTSAVKANIGALLKSIPAAHSLVCTGSTSNTKITRADIALAKARATAACGYAKSLLPALKTQTKLNPASGAAASARNVLLNISE